MSSKHTPGPWKVGDYQEGAGSLPVNGPIGWGRVAYIAPRPAVTRTEQREVEYANARLIAAAPSVVLAAKELIAEIRGIECWSDDCPELAARVRHLENEIRLAEGDGA